MNKTPIKIISRDKVQLIQDQINLIELAFIGQIPPDDAEFIEKVQKYSKRDTGGKKEVFPKLQSYFIEKYDLEFGMLFLAAIMGGDEQYKKTRKSIEALRAKERIEKEN